MNDEHEVDAMEIMDLESLCTLNLIEAVADAGMALSSQARLAALQERGSAQPKDCSIVDLDNLDVPSRECTAGSVDL